MTSANSCFNGVVGVRDALGATFVQKAEPESLRGKYGIWAGVNIAHASDAPETAATEIALWTQEGGLTESENADNLARTYVDKYAKTDVDYTAEIRNQVKASIEKGDVSDHVLESLETLFGEDSEGVPESEVRALAQAVFDFVKEEVEKQ